MDVTDLVFIDATGYHVADYPTFLTWLQDQYRSIYGADVYLESDSQDGQWIAIQAKALYDTASLGQAVYNSFSPLSAQGAGLSRVVKINGLTRLVPSFSTVTLTIVGQADTIIENGVATDTLQQKWLLPASVTIPIGGSVDVVATAALVGAVNAEAGSITTIFTPTRGWQSVTNAGAASPGAPTESDAILRIRQSRSTAIPSLTVLDGTVGSVSNIPGVTKVQAYENDGDTTDGNGIPSHSISVVVAGGDDTAIANAIAIHKTPGTGTAGDTAVPVTDSHGMPLTIRFQRAAVATIKVEVTISVNDAWSTDYVVLIQNAVAAVINAVPIGGNNNNNVILLTKLYAPAYLIGTAAGQSYDIAAIEMAKNADPLAPSNVSLDYDENPVCDPLTDVTVVIT